MLALLAIALPAHAAAVILPPCDPSQPGVQLIATAADWASIDRNDKTVFCVQPGNYEGVTVRLRSRETPARRRYLRYFDPAAPDRGAHPAAMPEAKRASIRRLQIDGGGWVVDRITVRTTEEVRGNLVRFANRPECTNNVLDRLLVEGSGDGGGQVSLGGTANVLQNSVVRNTIRSGGRDNHCVLLSGNDNRVVGNEIYNCAGDCIQIPERAGAGSVVADNDLSSYGENALDIKGSGTSGRWIRVEGNRVWNTTPHGGGTSPETAALDFSYGSDRNTPSGYVIFRGNVVWDARWGFATTTAAKENWSAHHISLVGNLFWRLRELAVGPFRSTSAFEMYYNTIIDIPGSGRWVAPLPAGSDVRCNLVVNGAGAAKTTEPLDADFNAYYGTPGRLASPGTGDLVRAAAADAKNDRHCFVRSRFTARETVCIPHARTTAASPHRALCAAARAGALPGRGVDDVVHTGAAAGAPL